MSDYEAREARAQQILAAQMELTGRLVGQHTEAEYLAAHAAAEAEALAAGPAMELPEKPPRDVVAGTLVHGVIEKELAADGRRLEDVGADEYLSLYAEGERQIYGGVR